MDHTKALVHHGLGERELLVIRGLATDFLGAFPVASKTAKHVLSSLIRYLELDRASAFDTDRAPELVAAVRDLPRLPVLHRTVFLGIPRRTGSPRPPSVRCLGEFGLCCRRLGSLREMVSVCGECLCHVAQHRQR